MKNKYYELFVIEGSPKLYVHYSKAKSSSKGIIIFVHGVCHGAWCFEKFMKFFSEKGYECFALNLQGHGEDKNKKNLKGARLYNYAENVARCVEYCKKYCEEKALTNEKPFLLGHSMGGAVVQKYVGDSSDKLKGAILFAPATAGGMNRWKTIWDTMTKKNLRIAAFKACGLKIKDEDMAQSAFFDGRIKSMEDIKRYNILLQEESFWITMQDLYKKYTDNDNANIPVLVIGSEADSYFPEESLWKTAEFYHTETVILTQLCHDMMLDPEWEKAAEVVLKFLDKNS